MEREDDAIDRLTGLPTFKALRSALRDPVAAIFLDIDGLGLVNHRFGHLAGDAVLTSLGAWLKTESESLRGHVFRVAGDEFILLLPERTIDDAVVIAERLVSTVPSQMAGDSRIATTVSAVVFLADQNLPDNLRNTLESFAEKLYQREMMNGRSYGNVVR